MLGMSFLSFLTLTIIGAVVAGVYHYGFRYRLLEGVDSAFGKLVVSWVGAWLGSPALGHWLWKIEGIYIVPAILGSMALVHVTVLALKALAMLMAMPAKTVATESPKPKIASAA